MGEQRDAFRGDDLHGLVALPSVRQGKGGASRPILLAKSSLSEMGVNLDLAAVWTLAHFLVSLVKARRWRYDFVLFNGLASLSHRSRFGYCLSRIVRAFRIPTFIYWHETDWVLDRLAREHPASAARVGRVASDERVVHLAVSEACRQSLKSHYPAVEPIVVYNCTSVPPPFDRPVRPAEPPTVVNLASIQERKGTDLFVETAIKACRRHPTVEFIWLGHGDPFGTWRREICRAGLEDRILFPGYVDAGHLILRRASIFFLSSRDDPFPLSVLEAMSLARTVVTFEVGGAPEALAGQGYIVRPFDTDSAATAILKCLHQPPAKRINPELRERYLSLYTPERFAARLNSLLREQLNDVG